MQSLGPFTIGSEVFLTSASSNKNLRAMADGSVNALGGLGSYAKFVVAAGDAPNEIRLQCHTGHYLRIHPHGDLDALGGLGKWTSFIVHQNGNGSVSLQSGALVRAGTAGNTCHVGSFGNGDKKNAAQTGRGANGQFTVISKVGPFTIGSDVFLTSASSNKNLRVMVDGSVNVAGGNGALAKFTVQKGDYGNEIRLQNNGKYLRIKPNGTLDGHGGLGKWTSFIVHQHDNGNVSLQSGALVRNGTATGTYHVGGLGNGEHKDPAQTGKGINGQFKVV